MPEILVSEAPSGSGPHAGAVSSVKGSSFEVWTYTGSLHAQVPPSSLVLTTRSYSSAMSPVSHHLNAADYLGIIVPHSSTP